MTSTTYNHVAVVTGANKGVGLACVRQLALQYPKSLFNSKNPEQEGSSFLIYLTARNKERGEAALKSMREDAQLRSAKALRLNDNDNNSNSNSNSNSNGTGMTDIKFLPLDIDSEQSITEFADQLARNHPEGIDMLINNAGIALSGFDSDVVKKTIKSNYFGTLQVMKQLLPQVREGGRIVNVASTAGLLKSSNYSDENISRFVNAKSVDDITALMHEFTRAVEAGDWKSSWPSSAYMVSKAGLIGATTVIAKGGEDGAGFAPKARHVLVNSCCPGYVNTDMTRGNGVKTPDEGAQTPVLLALGHIHDANGEFWQSEKPMDWVQV